MLSVFPSDKSTTKYVKCCGKLARTKCASCVCRTQTMWVMWCSCKYASFFFIAQAYLERGTRTRTFSGRGEMREAGGREGEKARERKKKRWGGG